MLNGFVHVPFLNTYDRETPRKPGIYFIVNRRIGKFYIGSTNNLKIRRRRHVRELREKIHYNKNLQALYDYDPNDFLFYFETTESLDQARDLEQKALDNYKYSTLFLNIALDARAAASGTKKTPEQRRAQSERLRGRKLSEETKAKIREARKHQVMEPHVLHILRTNAIGKKKSEEHKNKISEKLKGIEKPKETVVNMNKARPNPVFYKNAEFFNPSHLAKHLGTDRSTVIKRLKSPNNTDYSYKE